MTPLSDLIAAIVARVIARRCDATPEEAPVPEEPRDRDSIEAWAEPEGGK